VLRAHLELLRKSLNLHWAATASFSDENVFLSEKPAGCPKFLIILSRNILAKNLAQPERLTKLLLCPPLHFVSLRFASGCYPLICFEFPRPLQSLHSNKETIACKLLPTSACNSQPYYFSLRLTAECELASVAQLLA
jgi:hypothetical protein